MKLVKAYIRPILLEDVYKSLRANDHCCITVFKGEGAGKYSDPEKEHGSLHFPSMHSHIVKLEIATPEEDVDSIIATIRQTAATGERGDGIIFVSPIEHAIRIRDGKTGSEILM